MDGVLLKKGVVQAVVAPTGSDDEEEGDVVLVDTWTVIDGGFCCSCC